MNMRTLIIIFMLLVGELASAQANYTKTAEIPPLRVTFSDLQGIINKNEKLVAGANAGTKPWREEIAMKAGSIQVRIPGHFLLPPNAKVPNQIDSFTYTYSADNQSPIVRIDFDFNDYRRILTVEGASPEQVDAIFSVTREDLNSISSNLGGSNNRIIFGMIIFWVISIILGVSGIGWYQSRNPKWRVISYPAILLIVVIFVLPTRDLLSGFMATRGEPSFMIRYGPFISFFGFIVSIINIPISLIQWHGKAGPATASIALEQTPGSHKSTRNPKK